jgi:hypothetical protein
MRWWGVGLELAWFMAILAISVVVVIFIARGRRGGTTIRESDHATGVMGVSRAGDAAAPPNDSVVGYAADCILRAVVDHPNGQRLSDLLNNSESIRIQSAVFFALDDGRTVPADEAYLSVGELLAIEPRRATSEAARRIRTRTERVQLKLGPYTVVGLVHAPPGADPVQVLTRRKRMVPLTEASVAFTLAGDHRRHDADVVIVNRDFVEQAEVVRHERTWLDDLRIGGVDPRAKDLTGQIFNTPQAARTLADNDTRL